MESVQCKESISLLIAQFACTVIIVPGLLHGVYNIPSSTSEIVSILVNVDEQTNCDGVEGLTITAALTENRELEGQSQTQHHQYLQLVFGRV